MARTGLVVLVSLAALANASAQELVPDTALEIELKAGDPLLEGHGPSRTFEFDVAFDGTLHLWAASKDFDPILRITDPDGEIIAEDDDSGGGTTAYIALAVSRNELPSVIVAAADAGLTGTVVLHAREVPRSTAHDLTVQRSLLAHSSAAREAGDYDTARRMIAEAVTDLVARSESEQDAAWLALLETAGRAADDAQDPPTANSAWTRLYELRLAVLPDDHPALQRARHGLAATLARMGDLVGARTLQEKVLEVRSRTLPDDDPSLQTARQNLAVTLWSLGDLVGARTLQEQVLEVDSRTLPEEQPELLMARANLAAIIKSLGDLSGARALEERVLEIRSRTLPDDHPLLQLARGNLASTIKALGDVAGARALEEKVLGVRSRTLAEDHPDLQMARQNLAVTMRQLGDLVGARALQEKVLDVRSRSLRDEHPDLQAARQNLAVTMQQLGDLAGARALQEKVLDVRSRSLRDEHPDLQAARQNLAVTIKSLGDLVAARALEEQVLAVRLRTLPDDHPDLQVARQNLAQTIAEQLERAARTPAREEERIGPTEEARARCAQLIGSLCRAQGHAARVAILESPRREAEERCSRLARRLSLSVSFAQGYGVFVPLHELDAPAFLLSETTRGAALVSAELTRKAAGAPSYAALRDALREASDSLARLAHEGTTSEKFDRARAERESVERELVALSLELSGGKAGDGELELETLAARLGERAAAVGFRGFKKTRVDAHDALDSTGQPSVRGTSVDSLCAFVVRGSKSGASRESEPVLTLVDLGPIAPIEEAVRKWRGGLGVGIGGRGVGVAAPVELAADSAAAGSTLRERIFDPLRPALSGAQRIVVALDDVLHLIPLDALPFDENSLLGEHLQIETRATLTEICQTPEPSKDSGQLVAFGDVDYGAGESSGAADTATGIAMAGVTPRAAASADRAPQHAGILRGGAWSGGFSALPGTGVEVRGIARCFADQFGRDTASEVCEGASATRERLIALAPKSRWLHIATHGWFAPESIKSWSDPEPLDKQTGLALRMSVEEQVRGMSPMLLCGLALAGANLPENEVGRAPGLVTADELSTLDLSNCELAVLSACDTGVGEMHRAGQGVASLQMALQMAGARSVITSLWKVPDEATKELMLDFYRRLWVEKKPKSQALWEAKLKLRNAKDERGQPLYTTRDWAAWVLTGDPN